VSIIQDKKWQILKPTLLLDEKKVRANIQKMVNKARSAGVILRPHFKTHQSIEIGRWFAQAGVDSIAVSSLNMAHYFSEDGWDDITVAINVNPNEIELINLLAQKINLSLVLDSPDMVSFLEKNLAHPVNLYIKIDTGNNRTGLLWTKEGEIIHLVKKIIQAKNVRFIGLLTHTGQTYRAKSTEQIKQLHSETKERLSKIQIAIKQAGFLNCIISDGDTPSCSIIEKFKKIDEIRPGNFVFYDITQYQLGVCSAQDIAVAVACPVIGKYPHRNELVVYGGAIHFSKDYLLNEKDEKVYGYLTRFENNRWGVIDKDVYLHTLYQEHGKVKVSDTIMKQTKIGDILIFLPIHSCLTVNLYRQYITLEGKTITKFIET
jgi:D-serine deaminase-like pyridoxal phosphate-dependent protein